MKSIRITLFFLPGTYCNEQNWFLKQAILDTQEAKQYVCLKFARFKNFLVHCQVDGVFKNGFSSVTHTNDGFLPPIYKKKKLLLSLWNPQIQFLNQPTGPVKDSLYQIGIEFVASTGIQGQWASLLVNITLKKALHSSSNI